MGETPWAIGLPTARRLEQDSDELPDGVVFSVSQFPRATAARVAAARRNVREVLEEDLDRTTDPWTDKLTGERLELVKSYFNVIDPAECGATAFVISDGNLLGLRPMATSIRLPASSSATWVGVGHEVVCRGVPRGKKKDRREPRHGRTHRSEADATCGEGEA